MVLLYLTQQGSKLRKNYGHFLVESSTEEMRRLHQKVTRRIDPNADNVRFYWIPSGAMKKTLAIGSSPPEPPPQAYFL